MTANMTVSPRRAGFVHRAAAAICPQPHRQWVDAMFAELGAIDGPRPGWNWAVGAWRVVLAAIQLRATSAVSLRLRIGIGVALGAALGCGLLSYLDANAVRVDDDLLAVVSGLWLTALAGLAIVAARRVFNDPGLVRDEG